MDHQDIRFRVFKQDGLWEMTALDPLAGPIPVASSGDWFLLVSFAAAKAVKYRLTRMERAWKTS